jgi:hypothetical protein
LAGLTLLLASRSGTRRPLSRGGQGFTCAVCVRVCVRVFAWFLAVVWCGVVCATAVRCGGNHLPPAASCRHRKHTTYHTSAEATAADRAIDTFRERSGVRRPSMGTSGGGGGGGVGAAAAGATPPSGAPGSGSRAGVHRTGVGSPVPFEGVRAGALPVTPIGPGLGDWVTGTSPFVRPSRGVGGGGGGSGGGSGGGGGGGGSDYSSPGGGLERDGAAPAGGWTLCGPLGITSKVKVSVLEIRGNRVYDLLRKSHGWVCAHASACRFCGEGGYGVCMYERMYVCEVRVRLMLHGMRAK